jgi:hypothetical protein
MITFFDILRGVCWLLTPPPRLKHPVRFYLTYSAVMCVTARALSYWRPSAGIILVVLSALVTAFWLGRDTA